MIASEAQRRTTEEHLRRFDEVLANLEAQAGDAPTKLAKVEMEAVRALASDLREELEEHDQLRAGR